MGNSVFRYFQEWLRVQMREEAYERYVRRTEEVAASRASMAATGDIVPPRGPFWRGTAWVRHYLPGGYSGDDIVHDNLSNQLQKYDDGEVDIMQPLETESSDGDDDEKEQSSSSTSDSCHQPHIHEQNENYGDLSDVSHRKYPKLWELAKAEGDRDWIDCKLLLFFNFVQQTINFCERYIFFIVNR